MQSYKAHVPSALLKHADSSSLFVPSFFSRVRGAEFCLLLSLFLSDHCLSRFNVRRPPTKSETRRHFPPPTVLHPLFVSFKAILDRGPTLSGYSVDICDLTQSNWSNWALAGRQGTLVSTAPCSLCGELQHSKRSLLDTRHNETLQPACAGCSRDR